MEECENYTVRNLFRITIFLNSVFSSAWSSNLIISEKKKKIYI